MNEPFEVIVGTRIGNKKTLNIYEGEDKFPFAEMSVEQAGRYLQDLLNKKASTKTWEVREKYL